MTNHKFIKDFITDLQIPRYAIQVSSLNYVFGKLTLESYDGLIQKLKKENTYLLGGISPKKANRAEDDDVKQKNYFFIDFDIRNYFKEQHAEEVDDEQVKEIGIGITKSFDEDPILKDWRYLVFTGNGCHIYLFGDPVSITSKENWKYGMKKILKHAEKIAKMPPDKGCVNVGRISRLPGSFNHKNDRTVLVEILKMKESTFDISKVQQWGTEELKRVTEEAKKRAEKIAVQYKNADDTYNMIQSIPIEVLICRELGVDIEEGKDGKKNFDDPAEGRIRGYWVPPGSNHVIHGGTSAFSGEHEGYSPFEFIKMIKGFSNKQTFDWFKDNFVEVRNKSDSEFMSNAPPDKYDEPEEPIDLDQFECMTAKDIQDVLQLTIKHDDANKVATLICMITAYTEGEQFNISFIAPSSTGKSYIPMEVAMYFPIRDVMEISYCTPTAFFHDYGSWNKNTKKLVVDLSRKIIIFLDQPHMKLLERLRPLLSHDKKEMQVKITDKTQKFGMRTKTVYLRGYPSVIFCSAGMKIDEQESTRFFMLSPETGQEKIMAGVLECIKKDTDKIKYKAMLEADPKRMLLKQRIVAIRQAGIDDVIIPDAEEIKSLFLNPRPILKPRHQRDVKRLMSLTKGFAMLNFMFRKCDGGTLYATLEDIREAITIWDQIAESQEFNIPPFVYQVYKDVIEVEYKDLNSDGSIDGTSIGVSYKDILKRYMKAYGRALPYYQLINDIIPALEISGLVQLEQDPNDKRKKLVYPTMPLNISDKINNKPEGGVNDATSEEEILNESNAVQAVDEIFGKEKT